MKLEDVVEGKIKIGSTTYNMVEIKLGNTVVWPATVAVTYAIVTSSVYFSFGSGNILNAAGSNGALAYGDVQEYHNGTLYQTLYDRQLSPSLPSGSPLSISNGWVFGPDLDTTETTMQSYPVYLTYATSASITKYIQQEANVKTLYSIGQKQYDTSSSYTTQSDEDYYLSSFSASPYVGSSYPIPAAGGSANKTTLSYIAGHLHYVRTYTPWERYATYTFTSGSTDVELYSTGTDMTNETSTSVSDTPTITGSGTGFTRSGDDVIAANRGTTTGNARSVTYTANNNGITRTVTIYQEANASDGGVIGAKQYYGNTFTEIGNYYATISVDQYSSSANPCPASGGTATLIPSAYHELFTEQNYKQYITYTYTSGATDVQLYKDDVDILSTSYPTDNYTISGSGTGFSRSGNTVTIDNRGQQTGSARSATYTIVNNSDNTATDSVTVYQQANALISQSDTYDITCAFASGTPSLFPAAGGTYTVNYTSQLKHTDVYTSGSYETTSPLTSAVTGTNCTPSVNSVSGQGTFQITIGSNAGPQGGGGQRYVSVLVAYDTNHTASAGKYQDYQIVSATADIYPYVNQLTGRVSLRLEITSGTVTWPVAVDNVRVRCTPTGQSAMDWPSASTYFPTLSFPQPTQAYSQVDLNRTYTRFEGESGTIQVISTPTSVQIATFTCDSKNYQVRGGITPGL